METKKQTNNSGEVQHNTEQRLFFNQRTGLHVLGFP